MALASCSKPPMEEFQYIGGYKFGVFGTEHNAKLDFVDSLITDLPSSTYNDRFNVSVQFNSSIFPVSLNNSLEAMEDGTNRIDFINSSAVNGGDYLNLIGLITDPTVIDNYNKVDSLLFRLEEVAVSSGTWLSPSQFNVIIDDWISIVSSEVVYDSISGTGNDEAIFVANMEIAKSSYEYWFTAATDVNAPWGDYFEVNGENKMDAPFYKKAWLAIKRTAVDIWAFPSCPKCGGAKPNAPYEPYDLKKAWYYAGDQSATVE